MSITTSVTHSDRRLAWSLREAAQSLGVSERFLRNEIQRGKLMVVKRGKRVLIPAASLDDYLRPEQRSTV